MELFEKLKPDTTLITPNRRLAATLLKKYNAFQKAKNKTVWPSLDILPFVSWRERLWQTFSAENNGKTPLLLTPSQEHILWEDILRHSPLNESLLQLAKTADLAKSAWGILKQWRVKLNHSQLSLTEDSRAFSEWADEFSIKMELNHWIDADSLTDIIIEKIEQNLILLPKQLIIVGFTEMTPQQIALFQQCEARGTIIDYIEKIATSEQENSFKIGLAELDVELRTMARFAKAKLHENQTSPITIGCVIPHLENIRDRVVTIFSEVFREEHAFSIDHSHLPFNISAGKSLATFPVMHAALKLLNLLQTTIPLEIISGMLRSPFVGEAESERMRRARFDSRLRSANLMSFTLMQLFRENNKLFLKKDCPKLATRLEKLSEQRANSQPTQLICEWADFFLETLSILGWPGERSLNSQEYQVVNRFLELLQEYRTFDTFIPPLSLHEALHYLIRLTTKTIFQPESRDAPIQILGMLEAADIPFDYLWVMGLDDGDWPPPAKPNPFIPLALQKTLHMPHATADRELEYSKRLTTQLKRSAKQVIFSHSLKIDDRELRPSALIKSLPEITLAQLTLSSYTKAAQIIYESREQETLHDENAPSILSDEKIRGGVNIFKQQAACPFKAFAEVRLHAYPLASPSIGLRPEDRGSIVHKALEFIWQDIKNSETLHNLSDVELQSILENNITKAIQQITHLEIKNIRYLSLERNRLMMLLTNWLSLEKKRPPFKILSQEEERHINIGPLALSLRVDRIDELEDGSHLIIDYKTGKNNQLKYWFSERPNEPQLPLYCITHPETTSGIAFAEIHADTLSLKGISSQSLDIESIELLTDNRHAEMKNWPEQIKQWQMILEKLSHDFYEGKAAIDPKDLETCQYCHLKSLCRIHEKRGVHE